MNAAPSPERELFDRALDVPIGERSAFLAQACPDPDVRARVQWLLDAHDRAGDRFLAQSAGELAAAGIGPGGGYEINETTTWLADVYRDLDRPEKAVAFLESVPKF